MTPAKEIISHLSFSSLDGPGKQFPRLANKQDLQVMRDGFGAAREIMNTWSWACLKRGQIGSFIALRFCSLATRLANFSLSGRYPVGIDLVNDEIKWNLGEKGQDLVRRPSGAKPT